MSPSAREALELLREGTDAPISSEREAQIRAGIEASVGLALPAAIAAPVAVPAAASALKAGVGVAKALLGTSVSQTVLVAFASVAVGSAATLAIRQLSHSTPPPLAQVRPVSPAPSRPAAPAAPERATEGAPPSFELAAATPESEAAVAEPNAAELASPEPGGPAQRAPVGLRAVAPAAPAPRAPPKEIVSMASAAGPGSSPLPTEVNPFSAPPLVSAEVTPLRCTSAVEQQSLKAAQQAFTDEQPQRALDVLDRQHAQCPTGEWSPMSWTLRVRALCGLERHVEAQGLMYWYWMDHPKDARFAAAELREACPDSVIAKPRTER